MLLRTSWVKDNNPDYQGIGTRNGIGSRGLEGRKA